MVKPSKYWSFFSLTATGRPRVTESAEAKAFFREHFKADLPETDGEIQSALIQLLRDETAPYEARRSVEICLRCFISEQIKQTCDDLAHRFGNRRFSSDELLSYVLNDVDLDQPLTLNQESRTSSFEPLATKILQTFDPEKSKLSTWARRLTERDNSLNHFFQDCGIYRISDWSLLSQHRPTSLNRKLAGSLTPSELEQTVALLEAFQAVYQADRLEKNQTGKKCLEPTDEQLQRIADCLQAKGMSWSGAQVLQKLKALAQQLRQLITQPTDPLDEQFAEHQPAPESEPDDTFKEFLQDFLQCLDRAIKKVVDHRLEQHQKKQPSSDQNFLTGLYLFHCECRAMKAIAPELGLKEQYQVTRLLQLIKFWEDVRREMIELMKTNDRLREGIAEYLTPDQLIQLDQRLKAALQELIDAVQAENKSPERKEDKRTLLSVRLCKYLAKYPTLNLTNHE